MKIKELPISERPYEKLEMYGEQSLSNAELLAIIIKTGTKEETSIQLAQKILNLNGNNQSQDLRFLQDVSISEFSVFHSRLMSAFCYNNHTVDNIPGLFQGCQSS